MNIKLLKEIERKFHLGHFHDEKYLSNKQVLNVKYLTMNSEACLSRLSLSNLIRFNYDI